jgi:hypothetical protein
MREARREWMGENRGDGACAFRSRDVAFGFCRMTPAERLRHAAGGVFASMERLPALLAGDR